MITARLDSLDERPRRTLQLASVIGRSFPEPVLRAVSEAGDDLATNLATLQAAGLISETASTPEREYAFHHSLTQEATYGTILLRVRRELHRRVGEVFEELYASRIEEFAPLLARHFQEAGDDERTVAYATLAGDNAGRLHAHAEAVTHYENAIEAAVRLGRTERPLHHLYPTRGRALELSGRFDEAIANYEAMELLADGAGDRRGALAAQMALTTLLATPTPRFDAERGRELAERALALARELGDRLAESKALWNLMILNVFGGGDLHQALDAGERSLAIARELNAREQMAFTLNDLWRPYAAVGDLASSLASLEEATPIWRELGNRPMLSENLASIASLRRTAGEEEEALALSLESYRISEEIGNQWGQAYALMNAFGVYLDRGELGKAMAAMEESIVLSERVGFIPPQATTRSELASVYANLGDLERADELVEIALRVVNELQPISRPWVMGTKAELHLLAGELEPARSDDRADPGRPAPGAIALRCGDPHRDPSRADRRGRGRSRRCGGDLDRDPRAAPPTRHPAVRPGRAPPAGDLARGARAVARGRACAAGGPLRGRGSGASPSAVGDRARAEPRVCGDIQRGGGCRAAGRGGTDRPRDRGDHRGRTAPNDLPRPSRGAGGDGGVGVIAAAADQAIGCGPEAPGSSHSSSNRRSYLTTMSPATQRSEVQPESRAVNRHRVASNAPTGVSTRSSPTSS